LHQTLSTHPPDSVPKLEPTTPAAGPDASDEKRSWGWGDRRRRRAEAKKRETYEAQAREARANEARAVAAASMEQSSVSTRDADAEMGRLREVVEALWNDKKMAAATAQAQANDKVRYCACPCGRI
jgi:hypothetical protein